MTRLVSKFSGVILSFPIVELLGTGTTIGLTSYDKVFHTVCHILAICKLIGAFFVFRWDNDEYWSFHCIYGLICNNQGTKTLLKSSTFQLKFTNDLLFHLNIYMVQTQALIKRQLRTYFEQNATLWILSSMRIETM